MKRIYRAYNPLKKDFLTNFTYICVLWFLSIFILVLFEYFRVFPYFSLPYISFVSLMTSYWGNKAKISLNGMTGESTALNSVKKIDKSYKIFSHMIIHIDGKESETDIILVGEKGVFVVEVKNHLGLITGSENDKNWLQYKETKMGGKYVNPFYNPTKQVKTHVYRLSQLLKKNGYGGWIQGVVYFVNPNVEVDVKHCKIPVLTPQNNFYHFLEQYETKKTLSEKDQQLITNILKKEIISNYKRTIARKKEGTE